MRPGCLTPSSPSWLQALKDHGPFSCHKCGFCQHVCYVFSFKTTYMWQKGTTIYVLCVWMTWRRPSREKLTVMMVSFVFVVTGLFQWSLRGLIFLQLFGIHIHQLLPLSIFSWSRLRRDKVISYPLFDVVCVVLLLLGLLCYFSLFLDIGHYSPHVIIFLTLHFKAPQAKKKEVAKAYSGGFIFFFFFLLKSNTNKATFFNHISKHSSSWIQNFIGLSFIKHNFWPSSLPLQHVCVHMCVYEFLCYFSSQQAHALFILLCIMNFIYIYVCMCIYKYV